MPVTNVIPVTPNARAHELGSALINPDPALGTSSLLRDASGSQTYLPLYRSATQQVAGAEAFSMSLDESGLLQVFLEAGPASAIAGQVGTAPPHMNGATLVLTLQQDSGRTRVPLATKRQGGNIWLASTRLSNDALKAARGVLYDTTPNASVEVTQQVRMAAPLTEAFVTHNWANTTIRTALLDTFAGIPIDSAATFYSLAQQGDPDYARSFMVLDCTVTESVALPSLPGFVQWPIVWNGRVYRYYQDNRDPARVYFLPDRFELAVGPTGETAISLLEFKLPTATDKIADTQARFRYFGRPVVEFERIDAATRALREKLGPATVLVPLQDARGVKTTFTQSLPSATGVTSHPVVQTDARIDLSGGLRNEVVLSFMAFQAVWSAIFSESAENPLFLGWVDVKLSEGRYTDQVNFSARLPKQQEGSFFDSILDTSQDNVYSTTLTIRTFASVFKDIDPDRAVLEVSLSFGPDEAVTIQAPPATNTTALLTNTVNVTRSIHDIVLGLQSAGKFRYKLTVARADGTIGRSEHESEERLIYVNKDLVNTAGR